MVQRQLIFISFFTSSVLWVNICFASFDAIGAALDTANNIVEDAGVVIEKATSEINSFITEKVGASFDINLNTKKLEKLKKRKERLEKLQKKYQKLQAAYQKGMALKDDKLKRLKALGERLAAAREEFETELAKVMQAKNDVVDIINEANDQLGVAKDTFNEIKEQAIDVKNTIEETEQTLQDYKNKAKNVQGNYGNNSSINNSSNTQQVSSDNYVLPTVGSNAIQAAAYNQQTIISNDAIMSTMDNQFMMSEIGVDDVEQLMGVSDIQMVGTPIQFTDMNISDQIKQLNSYHSDFFEESSEDQANELVDSETESKSSRTMFSNTNGNATNKLFEEAIEQQDTLEKETTIGNKEMIDE